MTKLNRSTLLSKLLSVRTLRHGLIAMLCFSLTFTPCLALPLTPAQVAAGQTRNFSPPNS